MTDYGENINCWHLTCENCGYKRCYNVGYDRARSKMFGVHPTTIGLDGRVNLKPVKSYDLYYCTNCKTVSKRALPQLSEDNQDVLEKDVRIQQYCHICKNEMCLYQGGPFICTKCGHISKGGDAFVTVWE